MGKNQLLEEVERFSNLFSFAIGGIENSIESNEPDEKMLQNIDSALVFLSEELSRIIEKAKEE